MVKGHAEHLPPAEFPHPGPGTARSLDRLVGTTTVGQGHESSGGNIQAFAGAAREDHDHDIKDGTGFFHNHTVDRTGENSY